MKKLLILILTIIWVSACENQDQEWPDFTYQTVYFPYQTPTRTLSMGEDRIDNSLDKELQFDIGVVISGMYENKQNWTVDYVLDNNLVNNAFGAGDLPYVQLPSNYYTMSPLNTITIPTGSFNGRVRVQLTNDFLDDPLALTGQYVIPLILTGTSADSILMGNPAVLIPDRRITAHYESGEAPKDWVLFGIKFINAYEGTYLQRGRIIRYDGATPLDTVVYRHPYHREKDRTVSMKTISKNKTVTSFLGQNTSLTGEYAMELEFANIWGTPSGAITISPSDGALYAVTGTGQYFDKATSVESFLGFTWQSMHLNYTYDDGVNNFQVTDTLIFRDRGMSFETNTITIVD